MDIALYRARGGLASIDEFFDEVVPHEFIRWCGLHDLLEEFGGGFGFFDSAGEFSGGRETAVWVGSREVILLLLDLLLWVVCLWVHCPRSNVASLTSWSSTPLLHLLLVFTPHLPHRCQVLIVLLLVLETIQCLSQDLLDAHIAPIAQEFFGCHYEFGV